MNKYEMIYILESALSDEAKDQLVEKIEGVITKNGGVVEKTEKWGIKKLAYPIDYKTDGFSVEEFKNHKLAFKKLRERHRNQLMTYKRICEEIFEEAVDKVYIYSTVLGVLIEV